MKAGLNGVAGLEKVLAIDVRDQDLLITVVESIQAAVGIFFEHREVRGVVLIPVGVQVSKDSQAGLLVEEDESAEIAVEGLNAGAGGDEIVGMGEVGELGFDERFLQADMRIDACGSFADVDIHDAGFLDGEIVDVDFGSELDPPVDGTESCIAVKKVGRKRQVFVHGELAESSEESGALGARRADAAAGGELASIGEGIADQVDFQKGSSEQGRVAFEAVL